VYRYWFHVTEPLLDAAGATAILEIGAAAGAQTRLALAWCAAHDAQLTVVDPAPGFDVEAWSREWGARVRFIRQPSLEVLDSLPPVDAALVDGDHNWYTVLHELRALARMQRRDGHAPVMMLHDTGWPYGRRDMYYAPERVPAEARQPYEYQGMMPGRPDLVATGILGEYRNAVREGGPRNGVMTAVEDFVREEGDRFQMIDLPGLHGCTILAERALIHARPELAALLARFDLPDFARAHAVAVEREHLVELVRVHAFFRTPPG
jgi:hypothetical protein